VTVLGNVDDDQQGRGASIGGGHNLKQAVLPAVLRTGVYCSEGTGLSQPSERRQHASNQARHGKMGTVKAPTPGSATSCSMANCSTACVKPKS
jgi:hypothetical protein